MILSKNVLFSKKNVFPLTSGYVVGWKYHRQKFRRREVSASANLSVRNFPHRETSFRGSSFDLLIFKKLGQKEKHRSVRMYISCPAGLECKETIPSGYANPKQLGRPIRISQDSPLIVRIARQQNIRRKEGQIRVLEPGLKKVISRSFVHIWYQKK